MLELALVENIQREDLDAIEVAISYQRLIEEFSLTQEGLGGRVGKKRATIANYLRLLKLPAEVQTAIREKKISMGHARALAGIEEKEYQLEVFSKILSQDLSVRSVESLAKKAKVLDRSTAGGTEMCAPIMKNYGDICHIILVPPLNSTGAIKGSAESLFPLNRTRTYSAS